MCVFFHYFVLYVFFLLKSVFDKGLLVDQRRRRIKKKLPVSRFNKFYKSRFCIDISS